VVGRKKKYIDMFGSFTEPFNCTKLEIAVVVIVMVVIVVVAAEKSRLGTLFVVLLFASRND